jgi:hypothetical protein
VSAKVADPRDWWSLQRIVRTSAQPSLKDDATHSIDGFIRARLREVGLEPAPEADARTQLSAPEAVNLKSEPEHVLRRYGLDRNPSTWDNNINDINDAECVSCRFGAGTTTRIHGVIGIHTKTFAAITDRCRAVWRAELRP